MSRLLKGNAGLGPDLCLRLADLLGQDPAFVLRACGHARLSERICPDRARAAHDHRGDSAIDQLPPADQCFVQRLIERLLLGKWIEFASKPPARDQVKAQKGGAR